MSWKEVKRIKDISLRRDEEHYKCELVVWNKSTCYTIAMLRYSSEEPQYGSL